MTHSRDVTAFILLMGGIHVWFTLQCPKEGYETHRIFKSKIAQVMSMIPLYWHSIYRMGGAPPITSVFPLWCAAERPYTSGARVRECGIFLFLWYISKARYWSYSCQTYAGYNFTSGMPASFHIPTPDHIARKHHQVPKLSLSFRVTWWFYCSKYSL